MLFLKLLFCYFCFCIIVKSWHCCVDHPRQPKVVNLGTDVVGLIEIIAWCVFAGLYAFGGLKLG